MKKPLLCPCTVVAAYGVGSVPRAVVDAAEPLMKVWKAVAYVMALLVLVSSRYVA
jgi:hypothetical protein